MQIQIGLWDWFQGKDILLQHFYEKEQRYPGWSVCAGTLVDFWISHFFFRELLASLGMQSAYFDLKSEVKEAR